MGTVSLHRNQREWVVVAGSVASIHEGARTLFTGRLGSELWG